MLGLAALVRRWGVAGQVAFSHVKKRRPKLPPCTAPWPHVTLPPTSATCTGCPLFSLLTTACRRAPLPRKACG